MKIILIALPLALLAACEKAAETTLDNSVAETDTILETESTAVVNEAMAEQNMAEQAGSDELNSVGF